MGLAERPEPTPKVWANAAEFLNQEFGPAPEMLVVTLND